MKIDGMTIGKRTQSLIARGKYQRWRNKTVESKIYICTLFALAEGKCPVCGISMFVAFDQELSKDPRSATLDHITPLSQVKEHKKYGLQIMCSGCNNKKGDMILSKKAPSSSWDNY